MYRIRPIKADDFEGLKEIAIKSGAGFTSLPVDDEKLRQKIDRAERSFNSASPERRDHSYLFVLERVNDQGISDRGIVGTTGIVASAGFASPLYHYHVGTVIHHSPQLNVHKTLNTLTLCNDYTGATEVCTLFLDRQHRVGMNGRFLSRVRFLFMAHT